MASLNADQMTRFLEEEERQFYAQLESAIAFFRDPRYRPLVEAEELPRKIRARFKHYLGYDPSEISFERSFGRGPLSSGVDFRWEDDWIGDLVARAAREERKHHHAG